MGDTRSWEPPELDSDDSSPCQGCPSWLRKAILAGKEPVGDPTDKKPEGESKLLTDIGELGSVGLVSEIVALIGRLTAPFLVCVGLGDGVVSGT